MEKLQKLTGIADIIVFAAATLAIAGVFYEGMTLKWYGFVGILVICMDYSFAAACHRCGRDESFRHPLSPADAGFLVFLYLVPVRQSHHPAACLCAAR